MTCLSEKHIREVELENALKLYQKALKCHYQGDQHQAFEAYESLLASDVLQDVLKKGAGDTTYSNQVLSYASVATKVSSVALLPYLVFKNHASLMLTNLEAEDHRGDRILQHETLKQVLLEYATALSYDSDDHALWKHVSRLASTLHIPRLKRFALECQLPETAKCEQLVSRSLLWDDSARDYDEVVKQQLGQVVYDLGDDYTLRSLGLHILPVTKGASLESNRADLMLDRSSPQQLGTISHVGQILTVKPAACSWYALTRAIFEKYRVSRASQAEAPLILVFDVPEWHDGKASSEDYRSDEEDEPSTIGMHRSNPRDECDNQSLSLHNSAGSSPVNSEMLMLPSEQNSRSMSVADDQAEQHHTTLPGRSLLVGTSTSSDQQKSRSNRASPEQEKSFKNTTITGEETISCSDEHLIDYSMASADGTGNLSGSREPSNPDIDSDHDESRSPLLERSERMQNFVVRASDLMEESLQFSENTDVQHEDASPEYPRKRRRKDMIAEDEEAAIRASKRAKQKLSASATASIIDASNVTLERLFSPLDIDISPFLNLSLESIEAEDTAFDSSGALGDFKLLLTRDWHDEKVQKSHDIQSSTTSIAANSKLMSIDYTPLKHPTNDAPCTVADLKAFIDRVEQGTPYFHHINIELLRTLLSVEGTQSRVSYLESTWSKKFRGLIMELISTEEVAMLNHVKQTLQGPFDAARWCTVLAWSQAMFELLLDELIAAEKSRLNGEITTPGDLYKDSTKCWSTLVRQLLSGFPQDHKFEDCQVLRFQWASAIIAQVDECPAEEILEGYKLLLRSLQSQQNDTKSFRLPNCQSMHVISVDALRLELSKFSTLDFFDAVFESSASSDHKAVQEYLAPVLLETPHTRSPEQEIIEQYLARTSISFKLKLWEMLTKATVEQVLHADSLYCYMGSISTAIGTLGGQEVRCQKLDLRQTELLRVLNRISKDLRDATKLVADSPSILESWSIARSSSALQICMELLALLQVFVFYEDSTADDDRQARRGFNYVKFRDHCRQDLLRCWMLIYHYFKHCLVLKQGLTDETGHALATLLNVMHEELGVREYCALLNGALLELLENEIFSLDRAETECDLVQVLHCKYALSYQVGSFLPWEHYAKSEALSEAEALRILPFVLTFVQEKSPGVWLPKADIRIALERLQVVLWPLVVKLQSVIRNEFMWSKYLEKDILPQDLSNCLRGVLDLECRKVEKPDQIEEKLWTALSNLNLVLGRCYLSMFQTRNKNNNKGATDLEAARNYYQHDLSVNPRRSETWWALGMINAALADTEFGYDAQRIVERKDKTALLQKATLRCYMMAVNFAMHNDREHMPMNRIPNMLFEFGYQLYNASRQPLAMQCFERNNKVRYIERGSGQPEQTDLPGVSVEVVIKAAARCLHSASKHCTDRWQCHLLLGKVHEKLNLHYEIVLNDYVKAIQHAPALSHVEQGPLIDPHYRMTSSVYKYLQADRIEPAHAMLYMRHVSFAPPVSGDANDWTKASVTEHIRRTFHNICTADKRHWHHRPVYRLAYMAQHSPVAGMPGNEEPITSAISARTTLESLFTARGSGGNLLSIWKPEFERPGRHYYYANRYTTYYADLLFIQEDLDLVFMFMRRLRKAYASVLHHRDIWQNLCERYIALGKSKKDIIELDPDDLVDVVDLPVFSDIAKRIYDAAQNEEVYNPPALCLLRDLQELRKLNGGLYDANKIDDEMINCFLILYRDVQMMSNTQLGLQEPEAKPREELPQLTAHEGVPKPSEATFLTGQSAMLEISTPVTVDKTTSEAGNTSALKSRGRTKEIKIFKVTRRDILTRCFGLCKTKSVETRPAQEKSKSHVLETATSEQTRDVPDVTGQDGADSN